MSKKSKSEMDDELRPEYDLHKLLRTEFVENTPRAIRPVQIWCCWSLTLPGRFPLKKK